MNPDRQSWPHARTHLTHVIYKNDAIGQFDHAPHVLTKEASVIAQNVILKSLVYSFFVPIACANLKKMFPNEL